MNKQYCKAFISLFFILLSFLTLISSVTCDDTKTYIVYLGSLPKQSSSYSPTSHHLTILQQVIDGAVVNASSCLVRSYSKSFNGFAAKLTSDQRDKIADMDEVVSVFESKTLRIQTTRSWDFMGFVEKAIKRNSSAESDVVVGLIDTGIWPESESFSDEGLGGVPEKWRGTCAGGKNFTCNKKIVGARYYPVTSDSARDEEGHGTHTAAIAAGNIVHGVSFYGIANGTARGGVPSARIATYAACDKLGNCPDEDILSSFDDAISDGVHIISVSLSSAGPRDLTDDPIAIGSFHAMEKGILTVQAAGNYGPSFGSVSSVAPWILAVAASTTDRKIIDKLVLGNGHTLIGNSINAFGSNGTMFPIAKVNGDSKVVQKIFKDCSCFDTNLVKGKIVLCRDRPLFTFNSNAKSQGIVGVITASLFRIEDVSEVVSLPSLDISKDSFDIVVSYINSTHDPKAEIKRSEICVDKMAPRTIDFSARGPNFYVAEILKPDISAPGVDILAAYSPVAPVSEFADENRSVKYNFLSGTSMACPHVSGIAAYLKTLHPDWSPAAIKSAILTTARPMKKAYSDDAIGEFEYGSGHVDPIQASDPGLVYDISQKDYVEMLCNFGYDSSMVKQMSGDNSSCPRSSHRDLVKNLNYPLMGVNVKPFTPFKVQFKRTVTNVGFANSTYKASIIPAYLRLNITVNPKVLSFKSLNEKRSFVVSITSKRGFKNQTACTSSLTWSDGTHKVRSPIVLMSFKELFSS
ncbi:LOW QUALITY PROTEIN: subtilisin-like protease SBT4.3 [Neltuma alba]|uniref:LOW QUALITY PROTEIN: subtilisin-like protease SBT4.3 n=1 Tax=Neltuma alba TaxID=207710 RepID=UPI0010A3DD3E|nr:LOW QUALITY PROTEIN: subtilisin-like protease SBT4.3 [Prosopis alba]